MGNRFRSEYRQLTDEQKRAIEQIKSAAEFLAQLIEFADEGNNRTVTEPRMRALALTNMEQSVMWAVKGITG